MTLRHKKDKGPVPSRIEFLDNESELRLALRSGKFRDTGVSVFSWHFLSEQTCRSLKDAGWARLAKPRLSPDEKQRLIDSINGVYAALAQANPHLIWWASDTASKNRFSSPLPDDLEKASAVRRVIDTAASERVIIVGQPSRTRPMLKAYFKKDSNTTISGVRGRLFQRVIANLRKHLSVAVYSVWLLGRSVLARRALRGRVDALSGARFDAVFKTFVYNHSFQSDGSFRDPFFGRMPRDLKDDRQNILTLGHILGEFRPSLAAMARHTDWPVLPFEAFLSIQDLAAICGMYFRTPVRVPERVSFEGMDASLLLKETPLKSVQICHLAYHRAVRNLFQRITADHIFITCENYPWERALIAGLREISDRPRIIGYQHTVIPEAFLNYFLSAEEGRLLPLPDEVVTTGEATRDILETFNRAPQTITAGCALRFPHLGEHTEYTPPRRPLRVLIALEIHTGSFAMVRHVLRDFPTTGEFVFRVRCHPACPRSKFAREENTPLENLTHFHISDSPSVKDDLLWADAVMYSGTTVGMEAVMLGRPAIHMRRDILLSYDPLFNCDALKWTVDTNDPLGPVLSEIRALTAEDHARLWKQARDYVESYFRPVTPQGIRAMLIPKESSPAISRMG